MKKTSGFITLVVAVLIWTAYVGVYCSITAGGISCGPWITKVIQNPG